MKHILIPTDFSVQSLNAVHAAMATYNEASMKITLFHLLTVQDDISELLFRSTRNKHLSLITREYSEGCEILQNRYGSTLRGLNIKFGFGTTVAYLKNLLEGEQVTDILVCHDIKLRLPSSRSIEMLPMLKRTGYPITSVSSKTRKDSYDMTKLSMLGEREMKIPKTEKEEHYVVKK
jgi:hypothetical protein